MNIYDWMSLSNFSPMDGLDVGRLSRRVWRIEVGRSFGEFGRKSRQVKKCFGTVFGTVLAALMRLSPFFTYGSECESWARESWPLVTQCEPQTTEQYCKSSHTSFANKFIALWKQPSSTSHVAWSPVCSLRWARWRVSCWKGCSRFQCLLLRRTCLGDQVNMTHLFRTSSVCPIL